MSSRKKGHLQGYAISEFQTAYDADYAPENWALRGENAVLWKDSPFTTTGYQGLTLLTQRNKKNDHASIFDVFKKGAVVSKRQIRE